MTLDEATYRRLPDHLKALFFKAPNPASDEVLEAFAAFGERTTNPGTYRNGGTAGMYGPDRRAGDVTSGGDTGTAARFFYAAKASKRDRGEGNTHPTVKNTALMAWLVRLVTAPGECVLDPFAGSGSTGVACMAEGRRFIGIEREPAYAAIARKRLADAHGPLFARSTEDQPHDGP